MSDDDVERTVRRRRVQSAVRFIAVGRMALGTTFMLAPRFSLRRLLVGHRSSGSGMTFGRMTAGRDFAIGAGTLLANWSQTDSEFEWLIAGLLADSIDLYAFFKDDSFRLLPRLVSGFVAAGAVGLGLWTALNVDVLSDPEADSNVSDND